MSRSYRDRAWRSTPALRTLALVVVLGALGLRAPAAHAQSPSDRAAAQVLFEEGRKLLAAHQTEEACAKFLDSNRLDPAAGTLLNLGNCYEKLGRTASAWAAYLDAAAVAAREADASREKGARARAAALEPKLSKLTIAVHPTPELVVERDGVRLAPEALGVAVPVDPGEHRVRAAAPRKRAWETSVDVKPQSRSAITVPALEDDAAPLEPKPVAAPAHLTPSPSPIPLRTLGIAAGAAGVVSLGIGGIFALSSSSDWSDAEEHCSGGSPRRCDPTGFALADSAGTSADVATVSVIAGVALLAAGAVLYFVVPSVKARPSTAGPPRLLF